MKKLLFVILVAISFFAKAQTRYCGPYTTADNIVLSNDSSGHVYEGLIFTGKSVHFTNCRNITLKHCYFLNITVRAVTVDGGSKNVHIDSNYMYNVYGGLLAKECVGNVTFNYNNLKDLFGDNPRLNQAVQFNRCNGPGFKANFNNVDITIGTGSNPNPGNGDTFNAFMSNGTPGSFIQIYNNRVRGGGTNVGALGFAGVVVGDLGGSYQDVEGNVLVNSGYVGIQAQGGTHIVIKNNIIVSQWFPWSALGLGSANFSGIPSAFNEISNNKVYWIAGYKSTGSVPAPGYHRDTSYKAGSGLNSNALPTGWSTNIVWPASAAPPYNLSPTSVLPINIIPLCNAPIISYIPATVICSYGTIIIPLIPANTGGAVTSWSVSPALPAGLSLSTSTGIISGTPTVTHVTATYTVSATNDAGTGTTGISITINKSVLTVTANSQYKQQGAPNPPLTISYLGFKLSDNAGSLAVQPTASTTAGTSSPPRLYDITLSGGVSSNYTFDYHNGFLAVLPGSQKIFLRLGGYVILH